MKCTYKRKKGTKGGKILKSEYNSYEDLYNHLKSLNEDVALKGVSDIIFSEKSPAENTIEVLSNIASVQNLSRKYNEGNEYYDKSEDKDIIDLHEIIEKEQALGEDLVLKYNESAIKKNLIAKHTAEGKSKKEAEELVDKLFESYKKVEKYSYYLHTIINLHLKHPKMDVLQIVKATEDVIKKNGEGEEILIDSTIVNSLMQQIDNFIKTLPSFGIKPAKIIPNFGILGEIENSDKKIYSNIDLIVVDDSGTPHIFLFKSSIKSQSEQDKIKLYKRDLYLGFNRQLIEAQGIDTSRSKLCIVPMQIKLDENNNLSKVSLESAEDRIILGKDGGSDLSVGGKIHSAAKSIIKTVIKPIRIIGGISTNVEKTMTTFFPTRDLTYVKEETTYNYFLKHKVQTVSGAEHFYEFTSIDGKTVRIKSPDPKESNVELKNEIKKELQKIKDNRQGTVSSFIGDFERTVKNKKSIDSIRMNDSARGNLNVSIGKYTDGTWEIPKGMEALEELGIVLLQNKHSKQIDLIVLSNELISDLTTPFSLGLGDSILGCFKKNTSVANDRNLLKATNGNIELIKVMVALNELATKEASNLGSYTIGEIKAVNLFTGVTNPVQPSTLRHSFNALCEITKTKNNISNLTFMSDIEILKSRLLSVMETVTDNITYKKMYSDFEGINLQDKLATTRYLVKLSEELESKHRFLIGGYKSAAKSAVTTEENIILDLYLTIQRTIAFVNGEFHQPTPMSSSIGSTQKGDFLNGRLTTTPDVAPDENIRRAASLARGGFTQIRHRIMNFHDEFRSKVVKPLEQAKGHNKLEHIVVGNQTKIFKNLFRQTNGKLDSRMLFKNPYENDPTMTSEEKKFLKEVLWIINKRRFNLSSQDSPAAKAAMKTEKWFWVPLVEADTSSKIDSSYFAEKIVEEAKNIISGIERTKKRFTESEEGLYSPGEINRSNESIANYTMLNRFSYSEENEETRKMLLNSQVPSFWETNIETIVTKFEGAYIRKEVLDSILPIVKSIKILTELHGDVMNINTEENVKFLDNFIKQAVHNRSILSDDEKAFAGYLRKGRILTSTLMIAGNIVAPVRDTLEGVWKTISIFIADTWGESKGFTKADYLWAMKTLLGDNLASMTNVTLCEALNLRFGIANVDISILEARARYNKTGIFNFRDKMFWTSTAGDYFNRMCMFLAKMKHDGCFEACSFKDGFKYDWRKDKRFSIYASGKKDHPKYKEQLGLYQSYLSDFAEQGMECKDGNLPMPYTPNEVNVIKSFADRMYGYYDHDVRMQAEKTALGAIFYQFSTWITANKTVWLLPKGYYDQAIRVQRIDEATGKPMFWKEVVEEDGSLRYIPTLEDTGSPIYVTGRTYMEGIFYTLQEFYSDFRKFGLSTAIGKVKETDIKKQNLKLVAYQLSMWIISAAIIKYLIALWRDKKKEIKSDGVDAAEVIGIQMADIATRALSGSFDSYDLVVAFGGDIVSSEPPMIGMVSKMASSTWRTLTSEDKDLHYWLRTNVAAYRSVAETVQGTREILST